MARRSASIWVSPGPPRKPVPPRWRDGFYGIGWGGHYLAVEEVQLRVLATGSGETIPVTVPLTSENVRVYPLEGEGPVDVEYLSTAEDGRTLIWLHTSFIAERIEIDIPEGLLAMHAPGPLAEGEGPEPVSLVEVRPGVFEPPTVEGGETDSGTDSDGTSGSETEGTGTAGSASATSNMSEETSDEGCGCRSTGARGGLWMLLPLLWVRRRQPS